MATTITDLETVVLIAGSVLAAVVILLLCLVIGAYVWLFQLKKKISNLDPLANYKIGRPKLVKSRAPPVPAPDYLRNDFPGYENSRFAHPGTPTTPKQSFSNDNFSFGNNFASDSQPSHNFLANRDASQYY